MALGDLEPRLSELTLTPNSYNQPVPELALATSYTIPIMLVTAPDHSFDPQETTQGVTNTPSTPEEPPSIDLPDDYSHEFNKCYIKRQRVNCDGKYSPCPSPSPNSSLSPSPFPSPEEISAPSTPSPAWLPPPLSQAILEPNNKTKNRACILDKLMADLGTVFNAETLKEVDQEVCFGMVC